MRIALKSRVLNQMKSGIEYNEMVPRCWVTWTSKASITAKGSWPGVVSCPGRKCSRIEFSSPGGAAELSRAAWVSPTSNNRMNGIAASSASNVSALARKGMWFSSAI